MCAENTFQPDSGQTQCIRCPEDTITNKKVGSAKCEPCPPGSFTGGRIFIECLVCGPGGFFTRTATPFGHSGVRFEEGIGHCQLCGQGTFSNSTGATECKKCPPGQTSSFGLRSTSCSGCKPGSFLSLTTGKCGPCPPGTYQPQAEASQCIPCPSGSITVNAGSTFCIASSPDTPSCPAGSGFVTNAVGEKECVKCATGFASPDKSTTPCAQCFGVSVPTPDGSACVCPTSYKYLNSSLGIVECQKCPGGATSTGLQGSECVCPAGQYLDQGRNRCACPPRQRYDGSMCVECENDAIPGEGDCDFCANGYGVVNGSRECEYCRSQFQLPKLEPTFGECVSACGPDQFSLKYTCTCPLDFVYEVEAGPCKKCPIGTGTTVSSNSVSNECKSCANTYPARVFNGTECASCPIGQEVFNATCVPICATDRSRDQRTGKCLCLRGTELSDTECVQCPEPKLRDFQTGKCRCKSAFFENSDGNCEQCPGGTISDMDIPCRPCGSKLFRLMGQDGSCSECPEADPDVITAEICIAAKCKTTEFIGKSGGCEVCRAGTRLLNRTCVECGENQVSSAGRTAYCSLCTEGMVPNGDRSACVIP